MFLSQRFATFQGKTDEASQLRLRFVEIHSGPDHPDVAAALWQRAELLAEQVRNDSSISGILLRWRVHVHRRINGELYDSGETS